MKKSIVGSFILNITGLLSLFIIDMQISRTNDVDLVSSWGLTKSIVFIGVLFVLLGVDQAIVRMKLKLQNILAMALIQFTIMIFIIGTFLYISHFSIDFIAILSSIFLLAILYLFYSEHRLNMHYMKAQLFIQSWKVILFIGFFLFSAKAIVWLLPLSILIILLTLGYRDLVNSFQVKYLNFMLYRESITTGLHYFLSLLLLTISLYFDQILLNFDLKNIEATQLFSHVTFFVSPVVIILGFAGFIIGPYLRNNPDKKLIFFKKIIGLYLLIGLFLAISSHFLGEFLFAYFNQDMEILQYLSLALSIVVFLRYLYILPSVYIGSFATNELIKTVSLINTVGLVAYIGIYFFISRLYDDYLLAIILSIIFVWIIRVFNGYRAIYLILTKENNESV